jgi:hypothetical protein
MGKFEKSRNFNVRRLLIQNFKKNLGKRGSFIRPVAHVPLAVKIVSQPIRIVELDKTHNTTNKKSVSSHSLRTMGNKHSAKVLLVGLDGAGKVLCCFCANIFAFCGTFCCNKISSRFSSMFTVQLSKTNFSHTTIPPYHHNHVSTFVYTTPVTLNNSTPTPTKVANRLPTIPDNRRSPSLFLLFY